MRTSASSLSEAMPRLAVRLRSMFPDASVQYISLHGSGLEVGSALSAGGKLNVSFPNHPNWHVHCESLALHKNKGPFQFFESSLVLTYECLNSISENDFENLIAAENFGLRGLTVVAEQKLFGAREGERKIRLRAGFVGQKGRTVDETENLAIDILSLLRFARLLEDRILRSSVSNRFSYEMYHSQYISVSRGSNRYINYARSVFQGSTDRVFGQISEMLKKDFFCEVNGTSPNTANVRMPSETSHHSPEIILRVPDDVPMVTCFAPLYVHGAKGSEHEQPVLNREQALKIVAHLNKAQISRLEPGHFEANADGSLLSFVTWKHLTNDLRFYSLDHMITAISRAAETLTPLLEQAASGELLNLLDSDDAASEQTDAA